MNVEKAIAVLKGKARGYGGTSKVQRKSSGKVDMVGGLDTTVTYGSLLRILQALEDEHEVPIETPKLAEGDYVAVVGYSAGAEVGERGKIIYIDSCEYTPILVEFPCHNPIRSTGAGKTANGHAFWFDVEELRRMR
ncbi:MAG: hypothetical protein KJ971_08720 [Firmicutes bacterium]|nr:hypothetical protein [Bacillota bacterium]